MGYIAQFLAGIVGCNHAMGEGKLNALSRTDTPRQARLLPSRMPGIWSLGQGNRQTAQPGPRFVVGLRRQPCGAPPGAATIGADARLRRPPGATIIGACGATSAPRPARQSSGPTARLRRPARRGNHRGRRRGFGAPPGAATIGADGAASAPALLPPCPQNRKRISRIIWRGSKVSRL